MDWPSPLSFDHSHEAERRAKDRRAIKEAKKVIGPKAKANGHSKGQVRAKECIMCRQV